jgi:NAD(P)-dependent dehydrogenase (short-subunit alcohol dehydrogenase family)
MTKTIVVAGFGPGISTGVAERFGREGFNVALVARNAERLEQGVKSLAAKGVRAQAFTADLGNAAEVRSVLAKVRAAFGPISAIHWNAYAGRAGDLLSASPDEIHAALDIATVSLTVAVQTSLDDLRAEKGALLVTNGGFGLPIDAVDEAGVQYNAMGLSVANAAKHKLVRLLATRLASDGIYVGEVMITGTIKGTSFDQGNANLDPSTVGDAFWRLFHDRSERRVTL